MTMTSTRDPDDARLTAYALGELPASECGEIERLLASGTPDASAAAREIAHIRDFGTVMARELESEMADARVPGLSDGQRDAIIKAARPAVALPLVRWRVLGAVACAALAAGLLILVGVPMSTEPIVQPSDAAIPSLSSQPVVARREEKQSAEPVAQRPGAAGQASIDGRMVGEREHSDTGRSSPAPGARKQAAVAGASNQDAFALRAPAAPSGINAGAIDDAAVHEQAAKPESGAIARSLVSAAPAAPAPVAQQPSRPGAAPAATATSAAPALAAAPATPPAVPAAASALGGADAPRAAAKAGSAPGAQKDSAKRQELERGASSDAVASDARGPESERIIRTDEQPMQLTVTDARARMPIQAATPSYMTVRRCLAAGRLPPPALVHLADIINAFDHPVEGSAALVPQSPAPSAASAAPASISIELVPCPWDDAHQLASIRVHARAVAAHVPAPTSLVLLIDVSATMGDADRLALVKRGAAQVVGHLGAQDRMAIVAYSDQAHLVRGEPEAQDHGALLTAIDALSAGGGAHVVVGLARAAEVARDQALPGGVNRVVLCTAGDGIRDANDRAQLAGLARTLVGEGISLDVMAVGHDHAADGDLEMLAEQGHGSFVYLANDADVGRFVADAVRAPAVLVARSVVAQVSFNPAQITAFRLLGAASPVTGMDPVQDKAKALDHDTADLKAKAIMRDSSDDLVAGQQVVVLYELALAGGPAATGGAVAAAPSGPQSTPAARPSALLSVTVHYQDPDGRRRPPIIGVLAAGADRSASAGEGRFIAAVAEFGLALSHPQSQRYQWTRMLGGAGDAGVTDGAAVEIFMDLVRRAQAVPGGQRRP